MSARDTALLVIDAQESFRHKPYWSDQQLPSFVANVQRLVEGAKALRIPIVQIFHVEDTGAFSQASGYVKSLPEICITADATFYKRSHSALIGSGLNAWLIQRGIRRLIISGIRTEQCCETTARHASDSGYAVDFVTEATLTFAMKDRLGRTWSADEIQARTELVLDDRFARIVSVDEALKLHRAEAAA